MALRRDTKRLVLLKSSLEQLRDGYGPSYLDSDPLLFPHEYPAPEDQEVVGLLAAVFAYGQVPQILRNLRGILAPLSGSPARAMRQGSLSRWKRVYKGYAYRFQRREDLVMLLWLLGRILADAGSIQASFLRFYLPVKGEAHPMREALTQWVGSLREALRSCPAWSAAGTHRGILHLLADPASVSPCKRWNLYLRWMVRGPDGLDLGLWPSVSTRHLILPLDTHTARICRYLRLTRRTSPGWAMAEEITRNLATLDACDPVRYDFSIARLGILARCTRDVDRNRCLSCELSRICHAREDRRTRARRPAGAGKPRAVSG